MRKKKKREREREREGRRERERERERGVQYWPVGSRPVLAAMSRP